MNYVMTPDEVRESVAFGATEGYAHSCLVMTKIGVRKRGDMRAWLRKRGPEGYCQGRVEYDHMKDTSWREIGVAEKRWGEFEPGCLIYQFQSEKLRDEFAARWQAFLHYIPISRAKPGFNEEQMSEIIAWCEEQKNEPGQTIDDLARNYLVLKTEFSRKYSSRDDFEEFVTNFWFAANDPTMFTMFKLRWR